MTPRALEAVKLRQCAKFERAKRAGPTASESFAACNVNHRSFEDHS
jgi:hypothetical protein